MREGHSRDPILLGITCKESTLGTKAMDYLSQVSGEFLGVGEKSLSLGELNPRMPS